MRSAIPNFLQYLCHSSEKWICHTNCFFSFLQCFKHTLLINTHLFILLCIKLNAYFMNQCVYVYYIVHFAKCLLASIIFHLFITCILHLLHLLRAFMRFFVCLLCFILFIGIFSYRFYFTVWFISKNVYLCVLIAVKSLGRTQFKKCVLNSVKRKLRHKWIQVRTANTGAIHYCSTNYNEWYILYMHSVFIFVILRTNCAPLIWRCNTRWKTILIKLIIKRTIVYIQECWNTSTPNWHKNHWIIKLNR